jgi:hypothetical protein
MATTNKAFRVKTGLIVEGAELKPAAGTTSYPPILLTSGTNLTTATAGAFEYDGTNFYLTASTGGRKTIAFTDLAVSQATSTVLGTIKLSSDTAQTVAINAVSATASRSYGLQVNASGQGIVNVPWTDTVYTLPTATATALGGIELFSGTTQSVAANAVSATASRTYGLQLNSDLQGVVNVPWTDTDTNFYPTAVTMTAGTTAGPTVDLTMSGTANITGSAIPSASATASGVVTTGAQTFAGVKTLSSPVIDVIDATSATATTPSLYGNITTGTINIGSGVTNGTVTIAGGATISAGVRTVNINTGYSGANGSVTNIGSNAAASALNIYLGSPGITLTGSGLISTAATSGSASTAVTIKSGNATGAASGTITIQSGSTTTSGATGNITVDTGTSAGTNGTIYIGGTNAAAVELGRSGQTTVIKGNLQIDGTTTTVNSTTITVDDKNIVLGNDNTLDTQADGGGITLNGTTAKTLTWVDATDAWTSSEDFNLVTGKAYEIAGTSVLNATTLGAAVVNSSLTSVGTIATGTWSGSFGAVSGANLTNLTAGNLSGTIPSGVLANSTVFIGTTGVALNRASGALTLAGLTLTTPVLGVATATSINKVAITAPATSATLTIVDGKTLTASNTLTFAGTDGSTLNVGAGGTLGTGAFATISNYAPLASPALTGTPTINSIAGLVTASGSTTGTTALTLSTVYASGTYNGGEFIIKATNSTNIEITKVLVITDGTNVYMTTYGDVFVSADLVGIDFTYTGANVNMVITPVAGTTGTTTVKVTGTLVAV